MEASKGDYIISTDKSKINIELVHDYLCHHSYWAEGISLEIVARSIEHSLCFGIYHNNYQQVGFARVISDFATYAYLADLFVIPVERGNGLSKWLMRVILDDSQLQGLRKFALATKDAHGLYEQFGFALYPDSDRIMAIINPGIYKHPQ